MAVYRESMEIFAALMIQLFKYFALWKGGAVEPIVLQRTLGSSSVSQVFGTVVTFASTLLLGMCATCHTGG